MRISSAVILSLLFLPVTSLAAIATPTITATVTVPPAASVPQGAQRVGMLNVSLKASCAADITISSFIVSHSGLGDVHDLSRLYVFNGLQRVSRGAVPSDYAPATLRLRSFTLKACQTTNLVVAADFSPTAAAGGEHRLSLREIVASAPVTIILSTAKTPLTVTPHVGASTISAVFLPIHTSVLYGSNRTVARLRLTNDGSDTQDITSMTLTNDGSARDSDLQHLTLYSSASETISDTLATLDGSTARLWLTTPLRLEAHEERMIELHADVRASRRKTIDFILEEPSDIESQDVRVR